MSQPYFRYTSSSDEDDQPYFSAAEYMDDADSVEASPSPLSSHSIPPNHFLSIARSASSHTQQRRDVSAPFDTSTVVAADFDIDPTTGFMPPHSPVVPLPGNLRLWEDAMKDAMKDGGLVLGTMITNDAQAERSAAWRRGVENMPVMPFDVIRYSEVLLRRAHHLLTFVLHFYLHSQPPPAPVEGTRPPHRIPPPLAIPLVRLATELDLPPILTYSDNVLYNWTKTDPHAPLTQSTVQMASTFTQSHSEAHFYLTSARIELRGVEALELMRNCMDEAFVGDSLSLRRIVGYLTALGTVVDDLTTLLMAVRDGCDPEEFYTRIRPWFNGYNESEGREWVFEGVSEEEQKKFSKLSGPSAGQSSLVHALDVFLGVDHSKAHSSQQGKGEPTFLMKMEQYMPRHHRAFLQYLRGKEQGRIRNLVMEKEAQLPGLREAYDSAVMALKRFRDGHIRIATLYIVSQARKGRQGAGDGVVRGTGGTDLVPFLKGARDITARTALGSQ